ncbi:hypothetical protein GS485_17510 [Rhodococcus hoagii]|nr:hypothetical protein [Prescottella equi]
MIDQIHDDATIVYFVSPDGVVLHLSGGAGAGAQGSFSVKALGLGHVEAAAIFDKSARQIGEEYVDSNFDHGELDLPIYVFGNTVEEFHRRRDWLRTLLPRAGRAGSSPAPRSGCGGSRSAAAPSTRLRIRSGRGQGCSVQRPAVRGSSDGKGCGRHHT